MYIPGWIIPLIITVIAYIVAWLIFAKEYEQGSSYIDFSPLVLIFTMACATCISLAAWLVYFIIV